MKSALLVLLLIIVGGLPASAQCVGLDNGGNNLLLGKYYFRHVIYQVADNAGDLGRAIALYGNINFAGDGTYTITGSSILDSNVGAVQTFTASGTYSISTTGYGYISSAVTNNTDCIYGLVANGIFVGSTTETQIGYNDLFIAAQLSSPAPSNSSFRGNYSVAYMNFADGSVLNTYDALFQLNPDGNGNLGTLTKTMLQNIEVLSAGQDFKKDAEGKPVSVQVINLLVTPEQAEQLSLASSQTTIQLILRNPMDREVTKTPGTAMANLFSGARGMALPRPATADMGTAPARPRPAAHAAPAVAVAPQLAPPPPQKEAFTMEIISGPVKTVKKFDNNAEGK